MPVHLEIDDLYALVKSVFGAKISSSYVNDEELTVGGVLYESFELTCGLDERYGSFGAAIRVGPKLSTTEFFGRPVSMNGDPESIKASLQTIDRWCRARLTPEFLAEYDANISSKNL